MFSRLSQLQNQITPKQARIAVCVVLFGLWLLYWWSAISGEGQFFTRDLTFYALPMKTFMMEAFREGNFPFWTPHLSTGMPFFAEVSHQVLYPVNLVFGFAPTAVHGITYFVLFHLLAAPFAFYLMARAVGLSRPLSLWAAVLYGFSGYVISITDNVNYQPAVVWAPLAFWALFKVCVPQNQGVIGTTSQKPLTYLVALALSLCLMLLAGDSFNPMCVGIFGSVFIFFWYRGRYRHGGKAFLFLIAAVVLSVLIGAVQFLPTSELTALSVRQMPLTYKETTLWSFPPQRLIELIQPFFYGSKHPTPHFLGMFLYPLFRDPWADSIYIGLIPMVLFCLGVWLQNRISRFCLLATVLSLLLAFGGFAFYYPLLVKVLPILQYHRYLEKFLYWTDFWICLGAACGTATLWEHLPLQLRFLPSKLAAKLSQLLSQGWVLSGLFKSVLFFGFLVLGLLLFTELPAQLWIWPHLWERSQDWGNHFYDRTAHLRSLRFHWLFILSLVLACLFLKPSKRLLQGWLVGILLVAVLDVIWVHAGHIPLIKTTLAVDRPTPWALQVIQKDWPKRHQDNRHYRVFYDDQVQYQESQMDRPILNRLAQAYGYPSLIDPHPVYWPYRILYNQERMLFNYGITYGMSYLNGRFAPLQPLNHKQMDDLLIQYNPHLLLALAGTDYIISTAHPVNRMWQTPYYEVLGEDQSLNIQVLHLKQTLGRAYLVPNVVLSEDPLIYQFLTPDMPFINQQVELDIPEGVPDRASFPRTQPLIPSQTQVRILKETAEQYELLVGNPYEKGVLVVTESFLPGWQATVDKRPVPIFMANHRFMGIVLPKGQHRVVLQYHCTTFTTGLLLSVIGLLLCFVCLYFQQLRRWLLPEQKRKGRP